MVDITTYNNMTCTFRNMLFKIEDESIDGNEAVENSKANLAKAEDTIEAAQTEINVGIMPRDSARIK